MSNAQPNHLNTLQLSFEAQGVANGVHVAEDGGVEDAGVAIGHFDAGMAEHTQTFFRQTPCERQSVAGGVAGGVHRQMLVDFANGALLLCAMTRTCGTCKTEYKPGEHKKSSQAEV